MGAALEPVPDEIIKKYLPLVKILALRVFATNKRKAIAMGVVSLDDLEQEGIIGLIDAYRRFDPELGAKFRPYAALRIHGAIVDGLRRMDDVSPRRYDEASRVFSIEPISDSNTPSEDTRDRIDAMIDVHKAIEELPERERFIVKRKYLQGRRTSDIALDLRCSISSSRVSQILRVAYDSMRPRLTA